jgi:serine/threonine protein phosphatase PrpC
MMNGFVKIEKAFHQKSLQIEKINNNEDKITLLDRSGSCAIVVLIVEKRCYIANVGDSRAIMSGNFGEKVYALSKDHRPVDEKEYTRILEAGGKIYQTEANLFEIYGSNYTGKNPNIVGPLRVFPGKLSVCRAIGDIEAKELKLGGNPNVVIATPEIKYFDINSTNDFILIGCDGIFEKFKNKEIIEGMWKNLEGLKYKKIRDIHNVNGILLENLIDECISKRSTDNLTAVMISFKENLIEKDLVPDYICQTQQCNKIPKIIKTESNVSSMNKYVNNSEINQNNILSKIIRSTQYKSNSIQPSERFMTLNK